MARYPRIKSELEENIDFFLTVLKTLFGRLIEFSFKSTLSILEVYLSIKILEYFNFI